jgi:hypothetical protein
MRRTYVLFIATILVFGLAGSAAAQKRASRAGAKKAPAAPQVPLETFSFSTNHETWALGDPEPAATILFDGQPLPVGSRRLSRSVTNTGAVDITFPISGFVLYTGPGEKTDVDSVIARYEGGKLTGIYVYYKPRTYSLPNDGFTAMANGKGLYKTIASRQQENATYLKQAVSNSGSDPNGGLWVDTIAISAFKQTSTAAKPAESRTGKRVVAAVRVQ